MLRRTAAVALAVLLLAACGGDGGSASDREASASETDRGTSTTEQPEADEEAEATVRVGDHIHLAYGIYACDRWLQPLSDRRGDATGIHTHEDGLIHVHPFTGLVTGDRAVLDVFTDEVSLELGPTTMRLPDGTSFADGDDCGGRPGTLRAQIWDDPADPEPETVTDDLGAISLGIPDRVIAIVFAPDDLEVDLPRWAANLEQPTLTEEGKEPLVS